MGRAAKRAIGCFAGALIIMALTPGIAFAPWHRLSDTAYFDFKVCRDGVRLIISDTEYQDPSELATIPRDQVHIKTPLFTSPPVIDRPPEPEPLPVPPPESILFSNRPIELRFAPVGDPTADPNANAYSVHAEILWSRVLNVGDSVGFDLVPGRRDVIPREEPVANCFLDRSLDIRPFTSSNLVIPSSPLPIPVLVKSSSFIDATKIDNSTVTFGPGGARPIFSVDGDVDRDGDRDRTFFFKIRSAGIPCGTKSVSLKASTTNPGPVRITDGPTHYELYDSIKTIAC
jgi:hypothetical protein